MFAIKWAVGSMVNSTIENTKHNITLLQNSVTNMANDARNYIAHYNDKPAEQIVDKYKNATSDIVARHKERKQLQSAKTTPDSKEEAQLLENLHAKISVKLQEIISEIHLIQSAYTSIFKQSSLQLKNTEKNALEDLLNTKTLRELKITAEKKVNQMSSLTKTRCSSLELMQEIAAISIPEKPVIRLG